MNFGLNTLEDLIVFVEGSPSEGVNLEYKSSKLLSKSDTQSICKGVCALANSAGGVFILGIEASSGKPTLDGGCQGASKLDWLHRIISSSTFPAVETASVSEINSGTGKYYVITVGISEKAPHQSQDHRYYKRRGSHSDPMEHYEIEDVRNRPKSKSLPLEISLFPQGQLVAFKLCNASNDDVINNLKVSVETNFPFKRSTMSVLNERGLKQLRPATEHVFSIETFVTILGANPEPELQISATYECNGRVESDSVIFYLADFLNTSIIKSPVVSAIGELGQKIDKVRTTLEKLQDHTKILEHMIDGTGLRLSLRTIKALLKEQQRFDPMEFDWEGYRILLDITADEALQFERVFGVIGGRQQSLEQYKEIPAALREKFERLFNVDFDIA